MARTAWLVWLVAAWSLTAQGCTHFFESRTVTSFAEALEKQDTKAVHSATTEDFKRKALRHAKALEDLKILNLADGEISVVKVTEKSADEKLVYVEMGKQKRKLLYKVVRDKKTEKWLIDDIYVTRKKRGATVQKAVTEQMDLLLTVREFLDAWDGGTRATIIDVTAKELAGVLKDLPENELRQLAQQIVGKQSANRTHRPKAELNGDAAVVTLPRSTGTMTLVLLQTSGKWKVSDVAVESRGDKNHLPSLLKKAVVMQTANQFLRAYTAVDRKKLEQVCTQKLFRDSLKHIRRDDVASLPLQPVGVKTADTEVLLEGNRANYVLRGERQIARITLLKSDTRQEADSPTEYRVEDVALYDLRSKQEVRLASYFVARAMVQLFAEGLAKRDLNLLQNTASSDFRQRVFSRIDSNLMKTMPLLGLNRAELRIDNVAYHGSVTEVQTRQGTLDAIYVMREQQGRVRVDDVLVLRFGQQQSLKEAAELAVPIQKFATGIASGDITLLQRNSSDYLNRLIWKQTTVVPQSALITPRYLTGDVTSIERIADERIVTFGTEEFGAKVRLVTQHGQFVVDDVRVIAGREPHQQANLKQAMRKELATSGPVLPAPRTAHHPDSQSRNNGLHDHTGRQPAVLSARHEQPVSTLPYGLDQRNSDRNGPMSTQQPSLNAVSSIRTADAITFAPETVDPRGVAFADYSSPVSPAANSSLDDRRYRNDADRNRIREYDRRENRGGDELGRSSRIEQAQRKTAADRGSHNEEPKSYGTHPMMNLQHPLR